MWELSEPTLNSPREDETGCGGLDLVKRLTGNHGTLGVQSTCLDLSSSSTVDHYRPTEATPGPRDVPLLTTPSHLLPGELPFLSPPLLLPRRCHSYPHLCLPTEKDSRTDTGDPSTPPCPPTPTSLGTPPTSSPFSHPSHSGGPRPFPVRLFLDGLRLPSPVTGDPCPWRGAKGWG